MSLSLSLFSKVQKMRQVFSCIILVGLTILVSPTLGVPGTNITFSLGAKALPKKDQVTFADSYIKLYSFTGNATTKDQMDRFGTTDMVSDNENPEFPNVFWFYHEPGTGQKWHFRVVDYDYFNFDDEIGQVTVDVDEFVDNRDSPFNVSLENSEGHLIIKRTSPIALKLKARNLPAKDRNWVFNDLTSNSDPYVECYYRVGRNGPDKLFWISSVVRDDNDPSWLETIEFSQYRPRTDQYLHFVLYDDDTFRDELLGETFVPADVVAGVRTGATTIALDKSKRGATMIVQLV